MKMAEPVYVIDANVLMQAHRLYYAFPICPGFWQCLLDSHASGRLCSIDRVRAEITPGDALEEWVKGTAPADFFASTADSAVIAAFAELMGWVQGQEQFMDAAKEEFAQVADGWLAAFVRARPNHIVVTMEEYAAQVKKKVPLPNVCRQFEIPYCDTFTMLRELGARFELPSARAS